MAPKTIDYCLLEKISTVEDFLRQQFSSSSNKLKKHFDRAFLGRQFNARSCLKLPLNFVNDGMISPAYEGADIEVLFEDENLLVMNKNSNQHVHPLSYDEGDNCLSYLRKFRPQLLKVNELHYDRGLLYRLDYGTSGVLIYVKNGELHKQLRENFATIAKTKLYRCWVMGKCDLYGPYTHSFSSSGTKGKQVQVREVGFYEQNGRLILRPLRYDEHRQCTLMEVELETGLRHQIRAQLAHLGHPLQGDQLYGGKVAARLYLHALSYRVQVGTQEYLFEKNDSDFN